MKMAFIIFGIYYKRKTSTNHSIYNLQYPTQLLPSV